MPDDTQEIIKRRKRTKSGIMRMPVLEPSEKREPPMPTTIPELLDDAARTTGLMPIVHLEDIDKSAEREQDPATCRG